ERGDGGAEHGRLARPGPRDGTARQADGALPPEQWGGRGIGAEGGPPGPGRRCPGAQPAGPESGKPGSQAHSGRKLGGVLRRPGRTGELPALSSAITGLRPRIQTARGRLAALRTAPGSVRDEGSCPPLVWDGPRGGPNPTPCAAHRCRSRPDQPGGGEVTGRMATTMAVTSVAAAPGVAGPGPNRESPAVRTSPEAASSPARQWTTTSGASGASTGSPASSRSTTTSAV